MKRTSSIEYFKDQVRYKNALFLESTIGQKLYINESSIKQLFSILKELYNLANPRLMVKKDIQGIPNRCCLLTFLINILRNKKVLIHESILGIGSLPF